MTTVEITALIGQSNACGIESPDYVFDSQDSAFSNAYVYNFNTNQLENLELGVNNQLSQPMNTFGMELAWGEFVDAYGDPDLQVLVKQCWGGTSLYSEWNVDNNGSQYVAFTNQLDNVITLLEGQGYDVEIKTVIQVAGENDATGYTAYSVFEYNESNLINTIYSDYADYMTDATWYITEMNSPHPAYIYGDEVLSVQQSIANSDSRVEIIDTSGVSYIETEQLGVHYTTFSMSEIMRDIMQDVHSLTDIEMDNLNLDDGSNITYRSYPTITYGTSGDDIMSGYYVIGLDGDDTLSGTVSADRLFGMDGEDTIYASDGDDILAGGIDNDLLAGQVGNDAIYGEQGNDSMLGGLGDDIMYGGSGNDVMSGDEGNDIMHGNDGDDYMKGEDGDDTMFGYEGIDNMRGGEGSDTIVGDEGNDYLKGDAGDDVISGGIGNDNIYCGTDNDYATGGIGIDYIFGEEGNDNLQGGDDSDHIYGGDGVDYIKGDSGNDYLDGGSGRDNIIGGVGNDSLTGGTEYDFFIMYSGDGQDTITDFEQGDKICFFNDSDFSDLSITQNGSDVLVESLTESVIINNALVIDFDINDFSFL